MVLMKPIQRCIASDIVVLCHTVAVTLTTSAYYNHDIVRNMSIYGATYSRCNISIQHNTVSLEL